MIIVKLRGGLGNQLFQYALGRHLAVLNQTELKLDTSLLDKSHDWTYRKYSLDAFNVQATKASQQEVSQMVGELDSLPQRLGRVFGFKPSNYYKEPHFHFYEPILSHQDGVYLDGYWQSEQYFVDISSIIREDLTPKVSLSNRCQTTQNSIIQCEAVSVHIRRGDYTTTSMANRYLKPCEESYYENAGKYLAKYLSKPVFFVFSDDIEWAKTHLNFPFPTHYIEGNSAPEDLLLMASCRHHIIANSTFSWWGAWLNKRPDKIVIAPQKWFSTERFDTKDLLPKTWIRR